MGPRSEGQRWRREAERRCPADDIQGPQGVSNSSLYSKGQRWCVEAGVSSSEWGSWESDRVCGLLWPFCFFVFAQEEAKAIGRAEVSVPTAPGLGTPALAHPPQMNSPPFWATEKQKQTPQEKGQGRKVERSGRPQLSSFSGWLPTGKPGRGGGQPSLTEPSTPVLEPRLRLPTPDTRLPPQGAREGLWVFKHSSAKAPRSPQPKSEHTPG